jgi:hypothetical protein
MSGLVIMLLVIGGGALLAAWRWGRWTEREMDQQLRERYRPRQLTPAEEAAEMDRVRREADAELAWRRAQRRQNGRPS